MFPEDSVSDDLAASPRKLLDSFSAGDLEAAVSAIHPDCVLHEAESLPYAGDWRGHGGFRELVGIMLSCFDLKILGYEVYESAPDTVSMKAEGIFTSKKSGRSVMMPLVEIYKIKDGLIFDADIYYKDAMAINRLANEG